MDRLQLALLPGLLLTCCIGVAGPTHAQTCLDAPDGLVAWWPGDGDSIDLQSGFHAVAENGAGYRAGFVGDAFAFDGMANGQDDRVSLPPSAVDGLADMTLEMWVRTQDDQGALISGASNLEPFTDNELAIYQATKGTVGFMKQKNTGILPVFLNDGAWHHVAFTRSGAIGTLYIDGVVVDARGFPTEPFEIGPGGLMLGQEQDCLAGCLDPVQAFDGEMDEVSLYERALTDAEVMAIFEAAEAGKCKPPTNEELQLEIASLQSEISTLEARIAELEAAPDPPSECEERHDRRRRWLHALHSHFRHSKHHRD